MKSHMCVMIWGIDKLGLWDCLNLNVVGLLRMWRSGLRQLNSWLSRRHTFGHKKATSCWYEKDLGETWNSQRNNTALVHGLGSGYHQSWIYGIRSHCTTLTDELIIGDRMNTFGWSWAIHTPHKVQSALMPFVVSLSYKASIVNPIST